MPSFDRDARRAVCAHAPVRDVAEALAGAAPHDHAWSGEARFERARAYPEEAEGVDAVGGGIQEAPSVVIRIEVRLVYDRRKSDLRERDRSDGPSDSAAHDDSLRSTFVHPLELSALTSHVFPRAARFCSILLRTAGGTAEHRRTVAS